MAVEAPPHVNLFPPEIISNREMIDQGNKNVYENQMIYGMSPIETGTGMLPVYVSSGLMDMNMNMNMNSNANTIPPADSGLTCSLPISRKRSRDSCSFNPCQFVNQNQFNNQKGSFTFLGQDISMQIYQQQLEIDRFIALHTEKVRSEIEATRRRNSLRLIAAAEEGMKKRLRSKEEEIIKIGKLNSALEEKVKSLNVENQLWQQMAQTNEATANVLRRNLQQILTQIQQQQNQQYEGGYDGKTAGATADDVESCCGSNYEGDNHQQRTLAKAEIGDEGNDLEAYCTTTSDNNGSNRLNRWCRNCGKEEVCVLLLPCRHLCICTVCEFSVNICPICKSTKNATVHVNMSSF